jgi:CTP synthase (UTP-ammonia lyase)
MMKQIAIVGDFNGHNDTHLATNYALSHSIAKLPAEMKYDWFSTKHLDAILDQEISGYFIAPGSPYANMDNAIAVITHARKNGIPVIGTCGGFQHMILELARNVLGIPDAQHAEYTPEGSQLFISRLACSLVGREMEIQLAPGSRVAAIYGHLKATERYFCNFGLNPEVIPQFKTGGIQLVGADVEGEVRIVELENHPFFVGTLFIPQVRSTEKAPHPLITAFVEASLRNL